MNVDLNIVNGGETNLTLSKLLQEIEILMTAERQTIINNYDAKYNIDKYLFKYAANETIVAQNISSNINANCHIPDNVSINVNVKFLNGRGTKDIMLIEIEIYVDGKFNERLIYELDGNNSHS